MKEIHFWLFCDHLRQQKIVRGVLLYLTSHNSVPTWSVWQWLWCYGHRYCWTDRSLQKLSRKKCLLTQCIAGSLGSDEPPYDMWKQCLGTLQYYYTTSYYSCGLVYKHIHSTIWPSDYIHSIIIVTVSTVKKIVECLSACGPRYTHSLMSSGKSRQVRGVSQKFMNIKVIILLRIANSMSSYSIG